MKSLLIGITLTFLFVGSGLTQTRLDIDASCSFSGTLTEEQVYGFASDNEAKNALSDIMRYTGLPANFTIQAANVPNAAAAIYGSKRYILYSQIFMEKIKSQTQTDWSAISILAHEIGHHLSGHTLDNIGSRPDKELEADKFSGFILYKMGATLEEARAAMTEVASERATVTHPSRFTRLTAITNGWIEAKQLNGGLEPQRPITSRSDNSAKRPINRRTPQPAPRIKTNAEIANEAQLEVKEVTVEHNITQNSIKGMRIHISFTVSNMKDKKCYANAQFFHQSGDRVRDLNNKYSTKNGNVATREEYFTPSYESSTFKDYVLFLPSEELHLTTGEFKLKFHIGFFYEGYQIGLSDFVNFTAY